MCHKNQSDRARLILFGGSFAGALLLPAIRRIPTIQLVGVVWDDPSRSCSNANARFWRYGYSSRERFGLRDAAINSGIPSFSGSIRSDEFDKFFNGLYPDASLICCFGQFVPTYIHEAPERGMWNCHPDAPSQSDRIRYPGPTPFESLLADGNKTFSYALHQVTEVIDGGCVVARSPPLKLPVTDSIPALRKTVAPFEAAFIASQLPVLCGQTPQSVSRR